MANTVTDPDADEKYAPQADPSQNHPAGKSSDPRSENAASDDASDPRGEGPDKLGRDDLRQGEEKADKGLFNADGDADDTSLQDSETSAASKTRGFFRRDKDNRRSLGSAIADNKKKVAALVAVAGVTGSLVSFIFLGFSALGLPNFMQNIEKAAFGRFQVDMRGRSSKWLAAYMTLRLAEVDDKSKAPKDRDNLFFRADRVDNNQPLRDWYRTMRTGKFERDMFEKKGIKFFSQSYQDGNITKYRTAKITFNNGQDVFKFDPKTLGYDELDALSDFDINRMEGRLSELIEVEFFEGDKAGRTELRKVLKEQNPHWWSATKRWHLRQDIQNMIGVRNWVFFEKTRQKASDKQRTIRNKIITRATPDDSKTGAFVRCLFGVNSCPGSTDPSNPESKSPNATGPPRTEDLVTDADGDPDTPPTPVSDGSGEDNLQKSAKAGEVARKSIVKIINKGGAIALLDALARFNESIKDNSLSKVVVAAKGAQAVGLFTVFAVANDQLKTGEVNPEELNSFMQEFSNYSNSEGWATVVNPSSGSGTVSAASANFVMAKNKKDFCSDAHQELMAKPENKKAADKEFQYVCPKDRIGGGNKAEELENAWNEGPGAILDPILSVYRKTAGGIVGAITDVASAITGPVINKTISVLGIGDEIEDVGAYIGEQALEYGGGVLDIDENSPSGKVANTALQGSTYMAEASMRSQGAAATTSFSRADTTKRYLAWQAEESVSFSERYLSLSNPDSLLFRQAMALGGGLSNISAQSFLGVFASALSSPWSAITAQGSASSDDGYRAAKLAGIDTYDFPKECINSDVLKATPQSSTNADELGYFAGEELTWELMSNKDKWYEALYKKAGDKKDAVTQVWNCALLDNAVKGGMGAPYGYKGEAAYDNGSPDTEVATQSGTTPSGSAQDLAQQIVDAGNLTDQDGRYMAQIKNMAAKGPVAGTCNVNPTILKMLVGVTVQDGNKIVMSSLNRKCTGELTASGVGSFHYRNSGGHAIDVISFNGEAVDGKSAATAKYLEAASKYLPKNTGYGQVTNCGSGFKVPEGSYAFEDTCDHQHLQVPVLKAK